MYWNITKKIVQKIHNNEIIAWFEGGSEYGPRALCHRSLLANPRDIKMLHRLNEIKQREYWRPLAPVITDVMFSEVFDCDKIWDLHRYMLASEYIREKWRSKISAVCSVDYTARPQVIESGPLWELMINNDLHVLINTSLNGKNEPIIETPEQAIEFCKKYSDITLIFVENSRFYQYDRRS